MGLALLYEDQRETIPIIQSTSGLEYQLASAIKKLVDVDKHTVGIISNPAWQERNKNVRNQLSQTYNVRDVDLEQPVAPDIDLLLSNQMTDSLTVVALYNLDQYVLSGRPLLAAQSRINPELNRGFATRVNTNLLDLLAHYGIDVTGNLVADRLCSQIGVETQRGIFRMRNTVDYPFFPIIRRFNQDNIMVSELEQLRLFFASEIVSAVDSTRTESARFEPLLYTSDNSTVVPGPGYNIGYQNNPAFAMLNEPGRVVAGLLTGEVRSYFQVNPAGVATELIPSTLGARILVIGDGDFMADEAGGGIQENLNMFINAVDYLVGDEELISIRSREVTARPLKELSDGARRAIKWANILGPSALIVALGLFRWRGNRKRRNLLEEIYGS